jgi:uroporphyrinogen-III synthase
MPKELKLKDLKVAIFESRHSKTMGDLVALQGGTPVLAPSMQEIPLENNTACFEFAEKFFDGKIDILVLLTGVGTRALVTVLETRYPKDKILDAFKDTVIVPRGPKPIRVLREWGIPYAVEVPEPNTWRELMEAIKEMPLQGKTVAVQEYGIANDELTQALKVRGALVMPVPVYRWALPDDLEPLKKALSQIVDGQIDMALFTTSVQIDHVLQVARMLNIENKLRVAMKRVVIGSIGPDCTETLKSRGFAPDIEPQSSKMGSFVQEVSQHAESLLAGKKGEGI